MNSRKIKAGLSNIPDSKASPFGMNDSAELAYRKIAKKHRKSLDKLAK